MRIHQSAKKRSASASEEKILRIGVIQSGRIVEEKLLRRHEPVTIGASSRNVIVVPASSIPRTFTLFDRVDGSYELVFPEETNGRIFINNKVMTLAAVREEGLAKSYRQGLYRLPLAESSRGKLLLGDMTLLFQFIKPPPIQPRPQLPPSVQGSLITSIDWTLMSSYLSIGTIMFGSVLYLHAMEMPRRVEPDTIPDNSPATFPTSANLKPSI